MIHRITFDMLDRKLPRYNTIASNQRYLEKILKNEGTSIADKKVVVDYIMAHKEQFTALSEETGNPIVDEEHKKRNGRAPRRDFIEWVKSSYFCHPPNFSKELEKLPPEYFSDNTDIIHSYYVHNT